MKKRILATFVTMCVIWALFGVVPTGVSASTEGFYYKILNNEATITGFNNSSSNVTIPKTIGIYPVTKIGAYAFEECSFLQSVTIPDSVKTISKYAFTKCTNLKSITMLDGVTYIGESAFWDCTNLTDILFSNSLKIIGQHAFDECTSLRSILIPDSVTTIMDGAFEDCSNLESITFSNNLEEIGLNAFVRCRGLESITIPSSVTHIGNGAFAGCPKLINIHVDNNNSNYCDIDGNLFSKDRETLVQYAPAKTNSSYIIPNGVTTIGYAAFFGCNKLIDIVIPDSVTTIEEQAFCCCSSLSSVTIPKRVTSIEMHTFSDCTNLTNITIPKNVTAIGYYAFSGCNSLTDVYFLASESEWYNIWIGGSNSALRDATIHFSVIISVDEMSNIIITPYMIDKNANEKLEVLDGGSVHQYYKITYDDGRTFSEKEIIYSYVGIDNPIVTHTDKNGYLEVVAEDIYAPYGYEDYTQWFTAEILTRDGEKRKNVSGGIDFMVKVLPRPVTQKFSLTTGVKGEAGAGVGLELSSFEADVLKASASLSKSKSIDIEYKHNADGSIDVVLSGAKNTELGGEAKAGLFGSLWGNSALPSISIGKSGNVSAGATFGAELVLKDFFNKNNPNYEKNGILAAVFILENAVANDLSPSAPVTKLLDRLYSELSGEELVTATSSYTVKTENGGSASIDMSLFGDLFETETTITSGKDATVSTYSSKYSPDMKNNGDWSQESSITTNTSSEYFNTAFSGSFTDDKDSTSPSFSLTEFDGNGKEAEIKKSITAEYADGKLSSLKLKTQWAGDNASDNWTDVGTTEKQSEILSFEVKDDAMSELLERNYKVMDFKEGQKQFFSDSEITEAFQNLGKLDSAVIWSKTKNTQKIINPDLDFSMGAGVKLGLGIIFNGVASESYEYKRGLTNKNSFVTTDSFDGYIRYDKKEALDIVNVINDVLISYWADIAEDVSGIVKDTIENANAWISGNSLISATLSSIGLNQQTFSLMSLNDDRLSLQDSESSMDFAKTVGDAYCVSIENDADIAYEDINLNISYQNENVDVNDNQLSIYQWNGQTGLYTKVSSKVDEINKVVTAKITNGGQYVLGIRRYRY